MPNERDWIFAGALLLCALIPSLATAQAAVFSRIYITPGREAEAEAHIQKLVAYVKEQEPDVTYRYYKLRSNPSVIVGYEVFPSREAGERHLKVVLPAARELIGPTPEGLYARPPETEIGVPIDK